MSPALVIGATVRAARIVKPSAAFRLLTEVWRFAPISKALTVDDEQKGEKKMKNYFDQIPGAIKLASRVSVYVPSTTDTDQPTDNREQVEKVAAKLSEMFGGATASEARGYWSSETADLLPRPLPSFTATARPRPSSNTPPRSSPSVSRSSRT